MSVWEYRARRHLFARNYSQATLHDDDIVAHVGRLNFTVDCLQRNDMYAQILVITVAVTTTPSSLPGRPTLTPSARVNENIVHGRMCGVCLLRPLVNLPTNIIPASKAMVLLIVERLVFVVNDDYHY